MLEQLMPKKDIRLKDLLNKAAVSVCILVFMAVYTDSVNAGTLTALSSATYNGSNLLDKAHDVEVHGSGNIVVAGEWDDSDAKFALTILYDNNLNDIRYSTYQVSSQATYGQGVTVDKDGNIFVCGYYLASDWFTIKYDPDLSVILSSYAYDYSLGYSDKAFALAADSSGNVFVTGFKMDPSMDIEYLTVKYNNDLSSIPATASYNGPSIGSSDIAYGIAVDSSDNVYVTGKINNGTDNDFFTIKYDNDLVAISSVSYSGTAGYNDVARDIAIDDAGNVYVVGHSSAVAGNDVDLVILKYDSNLSLIDSKIIDGIVDNRCAGYGIDIDFQGNIIIGGSYEDSGNKGFFTARYTSSLVMISSATFNDVTDEEIYDVASDNTGNIYVTGYRGTSSKDTQEDYLTTKYNGLPVINTVSPGQADQGDALDVTVTGNNFLSAVTASFSGTGINVNSVTVNSSSELVLGLVVSSDALPGKRGLTLTNTDDGFYTQSAIFQIDSSGSGIVDDTGDVRVLGSEEGEGTVNPDEGDRALIYFKGSRPGKFSLKIFTLLGELVYKDSRDNVSEGNFSWIPGNIATGIYIAHIKGPGIDKSKKIAILR
ncbi:SBBP repeat-containing protein [Elusimicrobiota bacterium]